MNAINEATPARLYATLVGGALVIAGILGFFYSSSFATGNQGSREAEDVLGILTVNGWHNLVHIATGLVGLAAAAQLARTYSLAFGLAYVIVAIWGFLVTDDGAGSLLSVIPVNTADNFLHLILGLTGLAAGAATPKAKAAVGSAKRDRESKDAKPNRPRRSPSAKKPAPKS